VTRLRVLFLTHRLPYAPNRGDRIRAYYMLRALAAETDVALASLVHDAAEAGEANRLAQLTTETIVAAVPSIRNRIRALALLASSQPLTSSLLYSPAMQPALNRLVDANPPDVVLAYCSSMARVALEPPLDRFPLIIDMVDADSAKWQMLAAEAKPPLSWVFRREARTLADFEGRAMRQAYSTVAVNAREVKHLQRLAPDARIQVIENGVDLSTLAPPEKPATSSRVVFCGVMNYTPNEAGAIWLAREVWPQVRQLFPTAELRIVGAMPTTKVRALANSSLAISVTGSVPDVRPELWNAAVATAPLHLARGVQTKVMDAVAAGLPCVITSAVAGGLPEQILRACPVADSPEEFATKIVECLHRTPDERRAMAHVDLTDLAWERRLEPLLALVKEAARSSRPSSYTAVEQLSRRRKDWL
jgi:sugar transferase (PEP-CTERM/EpsH1 system associated)